MKNKDIRMISEEFLDLKFNSEFDMLKSIYYQLEYLIDYVSMNCETLEDKKQLKQINEEAKLLALILPIKKYDDNEPEPEEEKEIEVL